ncbi:hypothetical protein [Coxiella-like endosymbiont of Rhipicephalus sanguineus]
MNVGCPRNRVTAGRFTASLFKRS